jgi:hypothetical protein
MPEGPCTVPFTKWNFGFHDFVFMTLDFCQLVLTYILVDQLQSWGCCLNASKFIKQDNKDKVQTWSPGKGDP